MMNYRKFIKLTKDYLDRRLIIYPRTDLHIMPTIDKEDLLAYMRTFHKGFRRPKYSRFLRKLNAEGTILENTEKTIVFDPIFSC